jgi:hypothetical protein
MTANMAYVPKMTFLGTHGVSIRERYLNVIRLLIGIKKKEAAQHLQATEKQ